MEDGPFVVVRPEENNKKMSSYLKKHQSSSSGKCLETSSHGTSSTRSTTTSSLPPPDDNSIFPSKTPEQSSRKTSGFEHHSAASSPAIEFSSDFGNGLEFGQSFGRASLGDDGFGNMAPSPGHKAVPSHTLLSSDGFDSFGGDAFGSTDPFGDDADFAAFGNEEEPVNFGNDGFGDANSFSSSSVKSTPTPPSKEEAWRKREAWKQNARSKSSSSASKSSRHQGEHIRRAPRRHHSSDDIIAASPRLDRSGKGISRGKDRNAARRDGERASPRDHKKDRERSPPRRQRSGRRERRPAKNNPGHEDDQRRKSRLRDRSLAANMSGGSLDLANTPSGRPSRQTTGQNPEATHHHTPTHHAPTHQRAKPRERGGKGGYGNDPDFDPMQMHLPMHTPSWDKERSENQEKIMNMYRGGGTMTSEKKEDINEKSLTDLDVNLNASLTLHDSMNGSIETAGRGFGNFLKKAVSKNHQFGTSVGDGDDPDDSRAPELERRKDKKEKKGPLSFRKGKKSEPVNQKSSYGDRRDETRSRGTLLDRVVGGDPSSQTDSNDSQSKGLSYSDRIMMTQKGKGK